MIPGIEKETMEYIAYLHKDRKSDFGVSFPDFPGCVTAGKTLDEARRLASEALRLHIVGMIENGETIPEPSVLDARSGHGGCNRIPRRCRYRGER
jgi:predicted RNase H-like HicB family nuclease